jgi:hypothetical protein
MTKAPDPQDLNRVLGPRVLHHGIHTVTIFLAGVGLLASSDNEPSSTGALILVVSIGLWILDLRNRDVLRRLGDRGIQIERDVWHYEDHGEAGHSGFFLDREKRAGIQFLIWGPWYPRRDVGRLVRHAVGIDIVFLGVTGYAIALLV